MFRFATFYFCVRLGGDGSAATQLAGGSRGPRRGGDEFKIVSKEALTMSPTFALPERSYRPSAIEHRGPWRDPSP